MPELPDLLYLKTYLERTVCGRTASAISIRQHIVIRNPFPQPFEELLTGTRLTSIGLHGPFVCIRFSDAHELIIHLMLSGTLHHQRAGEKAPGHRCFTLGLDDGSALHLCDKQTMAKAYLTKLGDYDFIPRFLNQAVDIRSPDFTLERFSSIVARHKRKQVRVFLNDHSILRAIGNAYADEILFEARIHPKAFLASLSPSQVDDLYGAINTVMDWGIRQVELAQLPIHRKVREHMKVRNRKGKPCLRCGSTIRREGVRGYDVFFCPTCQPATRKLFLDWNRTR